MERQDRKKKKKFTKYSKGNFTHLSACLCRKSKTKPNGKKPPIEEKKPYLEPDCTKVRVVDFDLKELVVLPPEIDLNEWLASNSKRVKLPLLVFVISQNMGSRLLLLLRCLAQPCMVQMECFYRVKSQRKVVLSSCSAY